MKNEMMKGYIDGIVLSVLNHQDAYGYEISKYVQEQTEGQFDLKEGTMYPALKRMEANGYIEGYWGDQIGGPRRRYYRITSTGRKQLEVLRTSWTENIKIINIFLGGSLNGNHSILFKPGI